MVDSSMQNTVIGILEIKTIDTEEEASSGLLGY